MTLFTSVRRAGVSGTLLLDGFVGQVVRGDAGMRVGVGVSSGVSL